jgi:hypothetical protein
MPVVGVAFKGLLYGAALAVQATERLPNPPGLIGCLVALRRQLIGHRQLHKAGAWKRNAGRSASGTQQGTFQ